MDNKNYLWVVIGLLSIGIVVAANNKNNAQNKLFKPGTSRPFADEWEKNSQNPPEMIQPPLNALKTYKEAIDKANKENKPILLFFTGKTCVPCHKMKTEIAPSLPSINNQIIYYEVDVGNEPDIARKFSINLTPSYIVINAQEQVLKTGSGYKDVKSFGEWLAQPYVPEKKPENPKPKPENPRRNDGGGGG